MPILGSFGNGSSRGWKGSGSSPALFAFTSFTFTNAGQTGQYGPSLASCQSAYSGQVWLASYFSIGAYNGYQRWTVPKSGSYTITAKGAAGGSENGAGTGGYGAQSVGTFSLTSGEVLTMVVGQAGAQTNYGGQAGAGGGGSFVFRSSSSFTTSTVIVAAGGGAGITNNYGRTASSYGSTNSSGNNDYNGYTSGGSGGNGGNGGASAGGDGGAGISGNGGSAALGSGGPLPVAISSGGTGGQCQYGTYGGFGGGGGWWGGGGGGGGYSGGAGGQWSNARNGGGGGSYNSGSSVNITTLSSGGHGSITITAL